jgi:hypothetical protein
VTGLGSMVGVSDEYQLSFFIVTLNGTVTELYPVRPNVTLKSPALSGGVSVQGVLQVPPLDMLALAPVGVDSSETFGPSPPNPGILEHAGAAQNQYQRVAHEIPPILTRHRLYTRK